MITEREVAYMASFYKKLILTYGGIQLTQLQFLVFRRLCKVCHYNMLCVFKLSKYF